MDTKITTMTPEDAADELAKDIIARLCDAANKFLQQSGRVILGARNNPLAGFRLPFAPLANQIRLVGDKLNAVPATPASDEHLDVWFGGEKKEETSAQPVTLNAESIINWLDGKPQPLSRVAAAMQTEPEAVRAVIESPDSGLTISGPAKWVKAA